MHQINRKDIDFYRVIRQKPEKTKQQKSRDYALLLSVLAALALVLWNAGLNRRSSEMEKQLKLTKVFTENPIQLEQYDEFLILQQKLEKQKKQEAEIAFINESLRMYPALTGEVFSRLDSAVLPGVSIISMRYESATGRLSLDGVADSPNPIPKTVERIAAVDGLLDIEYEGYTQNDLDLYSFTVSFQLKGGEPA